MTEQNECVCVFDLCLRAREIHTHRPVRQIHRQRAEVTLEVAVPLFALRSCASCILSR